MNEQEELNKLLKDIENAKQDTESCFSDIEAREKAIKEMNRRHLDMALIMQSIALKKLKSIEPETITTMEALKMLDLVLKFECLALGMPNIHIHHSNSEQKYLGSTKSARLKPQKLNIL